MEIASPISGLVDEPTRVDGVGQQRPEPRLLLKQSMLQPIYFLVIPAKISHSVQRTGLASISVFRAANQVAKKPPKAA